IQSIRHITGILLGSQDIFHGTLLENITMGNNNISMQQITKLAAIAGLQDFVESCKQGYDTLLQPVGNKLSNNVRKNILLIRALLGEQRLLLLEHPFDHLEQPFKNNIIQYIIENKTATVLIDSQDEELNIFCDKVLMLNKSGEMVN
ncbi:MAG: hypothetical protein WKF91_11190, partial [Segetibacter sp.]